MRICRCLECPAILPPPAATGRPRLYCSDRCRVAAQRRRRREQLAALFASGQRIEADPMELAPGQAIGMLASDPDEAVVESIVLARSAAASFGSTAARARPQLSWRCAKMADHIAAGLDRYFKLP